ncbi:MAG: RNase adapter RapZ [Acidobacteria bacterium]|nr:RNase adapter RapZ [Acidobacteriota bacterium]
MARAATAATRRRAPAIARRRPSPKAAGPRASFVVVTGLSGAGKSHAIRALEDLGYLCVDNLPVALVPTFADLTLHAPEGERRAAVVIDVREGQGLSRFPALYRQLKRSAPGAVRLVFLDAAESALLRRFSETRRPHPLALNRTVAEGLAEERRLLEPIRRLADQVLDTSSLTVHELRRRIRETVGGTRTISPLVVTVLSFGFRHGVPEDADLVFDVRFLPNPHFVRALRPRTGRHAGVRQYVLETPQSRRFLRLTVDLLRFLIPQYIHEGKAYLTIAVGCTGGRHRSVAIAEAIVGRLKHLRGTQFRVRHRDVDES